MTAEIVGIVEFLIFILVFGVPLTVLGNQVQARQVARIRADRDALFCTVRRNGKDVE